MKSLRTGDLLSDLDNLVDRYLIRAVLLIAALAVAVNILITLGLFEELVSRDICFSSVSCYSNFRGLISPQVEVFKIAAAFASMLILVSGAYLAIRTYFSTSQVGMLGNAISHVTFFERFVTSELSRRQRLTSSHVDVFAIYELMFPRSHLNQRFAGGEFTGAVDRFIAVINESSRRYKSRRNEFKFDDHRRRIIESLQGMSIEMHPSARIDFLETEDEVLGFVIMLCRVFAPPEYVVTYPRRDYR